MPDWSARESIDEILRLSADAASFYCARARFKEFNKMPEIFLGGHLLRHLPCDPGVSFALECRLRDLSSGLDSNKSIDFVAFADTNPTLLVEFKVPKGGARYDDDIEKLNTALPKLPPGVTALAIVVNPVENWTDEYKETARKTILGFQEWDGPLEGPRVNGFISFAAKTVIR